MIKGTEKLQFGVEKYESIFEYNGSYLTAKEIVKATKESWKADYRTKNKIMLDWKRWNELENYAIFPHLTVELEDRYYILENGVVLNKLTKSEIKGDADIRLTFEDGRRAYYKASLVYWAFIDNTFKLGTTSDIDCDECWVLDGYYSNANIANIEKKDRKGKRK